jgi:broad specificity phosphatase PhoE
MIKTPVIDDKDTADVFLIRHGFSEFNYRHLFLKKDGGKDGQPFQDLKANPELCDANLHPIGVHQCLENISHIADINITRILVSPMQRAL